MSELSGFYERLWKVNWKDEKIRAECEDQKSEGILQVTEIFQYVKNYKLNFLSSIVSLGPEFSSWYQRDVQTNTGNWSRTHCGTAHGRYVVVQNSITKHQDDLMFIYSSESQFFLSLSLVNLNVNWILYKPIWKRSCFRFHFSSNTNEHLAIAVKNKRMRCELNATKGRFVIAHQWLLCFVHCLSFV